MSPSIQLDHIAIAVPRMADAVPVLVGDLGGTPASGAASRFYTFGQWRFAGGGRLEILEPRGDDGFLHRFVAQRGSAIHHVTFRVPSLRKACDRAEAQGYTIVGYDDSDPRWSEAFLHPKQALGIVVQLAETQSSGGGGAHRWQGPPAPPDPPPPVTVVGLRLRAHSRERARRQWETVLEGEPTEVGDETVVYRWRRSPLCLTVQIDPTSDEGSLGIEFTSDRPVTLRPGALGAAFIERARG